MADIYLVRHAQSEANLAGTWQGREDGPLSEIGREQAILLGRRLAGQRFDVVLSSPLSRALATAHEISAEVERDEAFAEIAIGSWEGKPWSEVQGPPAPWARYGGFGETFSEVQHRVWEAIGRLDRRLGEDGQALVVTHGGVLDAVLRRLLGGARRVYAYPANASVTRLVRRHGRLRLALYNDTSHLGYQPVRPREGGRLLAIIRHGRTRANVEGRWQGHSSWTLDDVGVAQAEALARWYGLIDLVYSSPLERALHTAGRIARNGPVVVEGLRELSFGEWEGLTGDEIKAGWPELFERIFVGGEDLPRGVTGETWREMTARVKEAIEGLGVAPGTVAGVVTHGGSIRAYLAALSGGGWRQAANIDTAPNTGVCHVALGRRGPVILDYGLAPHLQSA
jgi:broad specificity phosphatase PhoE